MLMLETRNGNLLVAHLAATSSIYAYFEKEAGEPRHFARFTTANEVEWALTRWGKQPRRWEPGFDPFPSVVVVGEVEFCFYPAHHPWKGVVRRETNEEEALSLHEVINLRAGYFPQYPRGDRQLERGRKFERWQMVEEEKSFTTRYAEDPSRNANGGDYSEGVILRLFRGRKSGELRIMTERWSSFEGGYTSDGLYEQSTRDLRVENVIGQPLYWTDRNFGCDDDRETVTLEEVSELVDSLEAWRELLAEYERQEQEVRKD